MAKQLWLSVAGLALAWIAALTSACTATTTPGPSLITSTLNGRVVDFESCFEETIEGPSCKGVENVNVALFFNPSVVSRPSRADGSFSLRNVPRGVSVYLLASDATGEGRFVSALQAKPLIVQAQVIDDIIVYAMQSDAGVYAATKDELGLTVDRDLIYFGIVLEIRNDTFVTTDGVTVRMSPKPRTLRYVKSNPRIEQLDTYFFPTQHTATGAFGQFVAAGASATTHAIIGESDDMTIEPSYAPLDRGYIVLGLHEASTIVAVEPTKDSGTSQSEDASIGSGDDGS